MAHFALIDPHGLVLNVITGIDEDKGDGEVIYAQDPGGVWKKTSYNTFGGQHKLGGTPFRKNYAGIGFTYDEYRDAFIPPKKYMSWVLNENTCLWEAPVPYPTDGHKYAWDERNKVWEQISE